MAVGDLLEQDGDVEWASLLMGRYDEGIWWDGADDEAGIDGLDLPEWRDADIPASGDGDLYAAEFIQSRTISARRVNVETWAHLMELREAMLRRTTTSTFAFQGMGPTPTGLFAYVKPRRMTFTHGKLAHQFDQWTVELEWKAADPRLYGLTARETTISGSNPTVPNDGNTNAPWVVVVTGPCTGPRIRRMDHPSDDDYLIDFDGLTVPSGQTLTVDIREQAAYLSGSGTVQRLGYAKNGAGLPAKFWMIPPGGVAVGFASDSGATTAVMTTRDTYL